MSIRSTLLLAALTLPLGLAGPLHAQDRAHKPTAYEGRTLSSWVAQFKDSKAEKREAAAEAVGMIGAPAASATPQLVALLQDKVLEVRTAAALALGRVGVGAKAAVPALTKILETALSASRKDDHEQLYQVAVDALGQIGPAAKAAVPVLFQLALRSYHDDADGPNQTLLFVGSFAESALVEIGDAALPTLLAALESGKGAGHRVALSVIGDFGKRVAAKALPFVERDLKSAEPEIRGAALRALGGLRGAAAIPLLIAALDEGETVAEDAATALADLGDPALVPLIKVLSSGKPKARAGAARAIGEMLDQDGIPLSVYEGAIKAVEELCARVERVLPPLTACLKPSEWSKDGGVVAAAAAGALGKIVASVGAALYPETYEEGEVPKALNQRLTTLRDTALTLLLKQIPDDPKAPGANARLEELAAAFSPCETVATPRLEAAAKTSRGVAELLRQLKELSSGWQVEEE